MTEPKPTLDECIDYLGAATLVAENAAVISGAPEDKFAAVLHDAILSYLRSIPALTAERDAAVARAEAAEAERDRLKEHGQFLLERLNDFDPDHSPVRNWHGHVVPALERFQAALTNGGPDAD